MTTLHARMTPQQRTWFRYGVDYIGILAFFVTYFVTGKDMMKASGGLVAGSLIALAAGLIVERRIAWLPAFAALAGILFGGAALVFHDVRFVKIKATAINACLGLLLLGGLAIGKNPLKLLLGEAVKMDADGWKKLTFRFGLFYLFLAVLNEVVWRNFAENIWIFLRFPGLQILTLVFTLTQAPLFMKHAEHPEEPPAPPPVG
jgi:intracellular septation protein